MAKETTRNLEKNPSAQEKQAARQNRTREYIHLLKYKDIRLHGLQNDKDQSSTNQDPSSGFFSTEKNPEKARGLQVPTIEKHIFNFLTLQLFVPKNKRLGGYTQ